VHAQITIDLGGRVGIPAVRGELIALEDRVALIPPSASRKSGGNSYFASALIRRSVSGSRKSAVIPGGARANSETGAVR